MILATIHHILATHNWSCADDMSPPKLTVKLTFYGRR